MNAAGNLDLDEGPVAIGLDHLVLWVRDAREALRFYVDVLGLTAVRQQDFEAGRAAFPSVRINRGTILDLMEDAALPLVEGLTGSAGGGRLNHLCLALDTAGFAALCQRLARYGVSVSDPSTGSFGARGRAVAASYLRDPSGNVIEIRHYGVAPKPRSDRRRWWRAACHG